MIDFFLLKNVKKYVMFHLLKHGVVFKYLFYSTSVMLDVLYIFLYHVHKKWIKTPREQVLVLFVFEHNVNENSLLELNKHNERHIKNIDKVKCE